MLKDMTKQALIAELEQRVTDKILEPTNFELLKKLIEKADSLDEAIMISELGTTYKRTGFHFEKRLEKLSNSIRYFKRNDQLSFRGENGELRHKLIIGDNYAGLLNLLMEYQGAVDVIYIDPPYGKDNMGEFAKTNYENAITRDNLLSMLYPRLLLAKRLLSEEGAIFCSIDDRNQAYVKGLFDEVFGESNFMGAFIWQKKTGGGQQDDFFVTEHEYVLAYRKTALFQWLDFWEDIKESDFKYDDHDGRGKYAITKLEKWGSAAHREDRQTMYFPITDPDGNDFFPVAPDGRPGRWRVGKDRLLRLLQDNMVFWNQNANGWVPYEKKYMKDAKGKLNKSRSILYQFAETGTATNLLTSIFGKKDVFDNVKPIELIQFILEHVSAQVVLDFFAGSGTTGHAVLAQNKKDGEKRKFILVQNNEITGTTPHGIAYDVTAKRLKRVMTGSCYDGTSNFEWAEEHEAYGDSLDVLEICDVANFEAAEGQTAFDVIDETLYGMEKFETLQQKIEWVCNHFEIAQRQLEA